MAKKESKQKKMNVRVDFTPMVDMLMLLITFFMLCTSLSKPQTMELTMPSNDENTQEDQKNEAKASETVTLYVTADNKIYYGAGIPKYDDPTWIKETTWGSQGIRKVLREHATENGTRPVERIALAVKELNMDRQKNPKQYPDSIYQKKLSDLKAGNLKDGKIPTLTIAIKQVCLIRFPAIHWSSLVLDRNRHYMNILFEGSVCGISAVIQPVRSDNTD